MDSDSAVMEPEVETQTRSKPKRQPKYQVVLWNDEDHTYEYVICMLVELFAFTVEHGFQCAKTVDSQGRCVLITTTLEHAELKRDQIHAYGKDPALKKSKGSMWATIEPVEESSGAD
ncbi:MAG: ATP-dependent Clp protease adaptor ClpS [Thermoguttaceae bacterium]|nr:ATP-dependent Clp protease adaptor ClpS [Thermoguttaceae bacterium]